MYYFNQEIFAQLKQTDFTAKKLCIEEIEDIRWKPYTQLVQQEKIKLNDNILMLIDLDYFCLKYNKQQQGQIKEEFYILSSLNNQSFIIDQRLLDCLEKLEKIMSFYIVNFGKSQNKINAVQNSLKIPQKYKQHFQQFSDLKFDNNFQYIFLLSFRTKKINIDQLISNKIFLIQTYASEIIKYKQNQDKQEMVQILDFPLNQKLLQDMIYEKPIFDQLIYNINLIRKILFQISLRKENVVYENPYQLLYQFSQTFCSFLRNSLIYIDNEVDKTIQEKLKKLMENSDILLVEQSMSNCLIILKDIEQENKYK